MAEPALPEESIFAEAMEFKSAAERAAFLDRACRDNPALRAQVESLLRADARSGDLLDLPDAPAATVDHPTTLDGAQIGPYKLVELIGEGGMGEVYLAQQTEPVKRLVALKVIKAGMDSRQVLARFEAERQALALMDHPNIARVLDAGTTAEVRDQRAEIRDQKSAVRKPGGSSMTSVLCPLTSAGRPYFVMELVKGVPITKFCDERKLTPRERLELFLPVCHAIQHAHQKGIIHRDIKPTNVLVALYDGRPVPKVIDFGVAKAAGQPLTERTLVTGLGAVVGTPEYMSPEQAELNQLDIDTRSDIYSLGILLYELLTGTTPLTHQRAKDAALLEVLRVIREEEPPKPSTRISTTKELPSIAANRGTEPARLSRLMRGELDWIVMKALEKDRGRRYETANGFAMDVQRYLAGEAVFAVPPSAAYRLRKFVRRNKVPVLAAAIVFLTLLCGIVGMAFGLVHADQARRAESDRANWERQAGLEAQAREAETRAVLEFVEKRILSAAKPAGRDGGLGYDWSVRQAIDAALPLVETDFRDQPLMEARLRRSLGWAFENMGEPKVAAEQFQAAHRIYAKELGPDHPDTLRSVTGLVCIYGDLGRPAEAVKLAEVNLARQQVAIGPDHQETLWTRHFLALNLYRLDRFAEAVKLDQETLALRKAKLGPDHYDTLCSMSNLALYYDSLGRHEQAHALNVETLALRKAKLGPNHPETLQSMSQLAQDYFVQKRYPEALELHQETLALRKARFGPEHTETLGSMDQLAHCLHALHRYQDALDLRAEALPLMKKKLGIDHPQTLWVTHTLAESYASVGRHAEAVKLHEEAVALAENRLGRDSAETLRGMNMLANGYAAQRRHADALKVREEVLKRMKGRPGPDHAGTTFAMQEVAVSLIELKRHAEAVKVFDEVLERRRATLAPDHRDTLWAMWKVAQCRVALGRGAEAVPLIDECVQRAAGKSAHADIVLAVMALRFRHFQRTKDLAGVRATTEMWERLNRTDGNGLYNAACFRAVTSALLKVDPKTPAADATQLAAEEANRAMAWLHKAIAAGFKDAGLMAKDTDLDALRGREDFKKVLAELEGKKK